MTLVIVKLIILSLDSFLFFSFLLHCSSVQCIFVTWTLSPILSLLMEGWERIKRGCKIQENVHSFKYAHKHQISTLIFTLFPACVSLLIYRLLECFLTSVCLCACVCVEYVRINEIRERAKIRRWSERIILSEYFTAHLSTALDLVKTMHFLFYGCNSLRREAVGLL